MLHMPWQLSCRGMCNIMTWSCKYFVIYEQHIFLQNLDYELIHSLLNGSQAPQLQYQRHDAFKLQ